MLLADEGDEIGIAVAVEIGDGHVNRAMAVIDHVGHKDRLGPIGSPVLQIDDLARATPAEDGDDQVELAVAVEISRLHVRDAAHPFEQSDRREGAVGRAAEPDHAADLVVGRVEDAQVGDDDVRRAIAVQIDDFGVAGCPMCSRGWAGQFSPSRRLGSRVHDLNAAGHDLAHEDVQPLLIEQVDEVDVAHRWLLPLVRRPAIDGFELDRNRPSRLLLRQHRQRFRRPLLVISDDAFH